MVMVIHRCSETPDARLVVVVVVVGADVGSYVRGTRLGACAKGVATSRSYWGTYIAASLAGYDGDGGDEAGGAPGCGMGGEMRCGASRRKGAGTGVLPGRC